jgi:meso-butanediol dehydrogenase / (S,S)-butanediol dehydrogenase / diacetyl reductase
MSGRFAGKVALVTGGASGIGAATARRLAAEGARVAIGDLDEPAGGALAKELGAEAGAASFHAVDVAELASVERLVEDVAARFGRLDVLVNNAGIGGFGETPDLDPDQWHRVIAVDLHSVFYGCRAAIPHLRRAGGGAIVNTASISGLGGDYGFAAYNAAKGAVANYTRTLALDHGKDGIRTNAVCPGPIDTPLAAALTSNAVVVAEYARVVPLGRIGRAEEVAAAIAFLASDDASYVNGACLEVDGGLTAHTGQPNFVALFKQLMGNG